MTCNVLVLLGATYVQDLLLAYISLFLFCTSLLGGFLLIRKKSDIGIHIVFIAYLVTFTGAAFSHLVSYPTILLYPIVIVISYLVFHSKRTRTIYGVLAIAFALANLYATHIYQQTLDQPILLINILVIGLGFLLSLCMISNDFVRMIGNYQEQLVESREKVYQKNTELEKYIAGNLQLENFAHLASHELRTPIKNISNFMGLLGRRLETRLKPDEAEMISLVNDEVMRMNKRIEGLLELSLTTNNNLHFERIATDHFLDAIIEQNFGAQEASISFGSIPDTIKGDNQQLSQLFIQLIDNGLKFQTTYKDPQIIIEGEDQGKYYAFAIHDNGIGIGDHLKDRIFLIFKRLHNDTMYDGTGIGLAICKKIVERHGGRIWVDDSLLGGSVFRFTLAKNLTSQSPTQTNIKGKILQIA